MPYQLTMAGAQPMTVETPPITWRFSMPYGVKRALRQGAVREIAVDDDENVRVVPNLERIEKILLFDERVKVAWEGVELNGKSVPYNSTLIEDGEIDDGTIMQLLLKVVGQLFGQAGAPTESGEPPPAPMPAETTETSRSPV